jgi:hypothetical protein
VTIVAGIRTVRNAIVITLILFSPGFPQTGEQITLTAYYPSPYGSYNEMRVHQMSIGSTYETATLTNGDLIVEGRVGIGTQTPVPEAKADIVGRLQVDSGAVYGRQGFGLGSGGYDMEDFWYDGGADSTYFFRHLAAPGASSRLIFGTGVPGVAMVPIMGVYNSGNVIIGPNALVTAPGERLLVEGNMQMTVPGDNRIIGNMVDVMVGTGAWSPGMQIKNATCMWFSSSNASPTEGLMQICDTLSGNREVRVFGNLTVDGTLSKGAGTFLIDHPLDPRNKILRHSFVESPDMKNIYDGIAVLDEKGKATVVLPGYFEALNTNFRYQLTPLGAYAPVYIKQEIKGNQFVIAGGPKNLKVSWMVTGSRKDSFAVKNPVVVEEEKGVNNNYKKGEYIYPEGFSVK